MQYQVQRDYKSQFEFMNPNGQTRRGISLSLEQQEGNNVRYQRQSSPTNINIRTVSPSRQPNAEIGKTRDIRVEDLNTGKFVQSMSQGSRDVHITYGKNVNSSYHPPPPQQFMFGSQHTQSHHYQPSQLPINSGNAQTLTVQTTQPLNYSIKRTHVPVHYVNEIPIPVVASETKRYEVQEEEEEVFNEADQQMLQQYQKLYGTYMEEKQRNEMLQRRLKEYEIRDSQYQGQEVREVIKEVDRPKKINIKLLASLLIKKNQGLIEDLVERRKKSCVSKLRTLFAQEQSNFRTIILRSSEQLVRVRTH